MIEIDIGIDVTALTPLFILYRKPDGTSGTWTAFAPSSTTLGYVTQTGDLDLAGIWELQPQAGPLYGDIVNLTVEKNLA